MAPHTFTEEQSKWLAGASRKALDDVGVLRVVAPPHSLRPLHTGGSPVPRSLRNVGGAVEVPARSDKPSIL
jgi:hypothetical protein